MGVAFSVQYAGVNFDRELDLFTNELVFAKIPVIWAVDWDFIYRRKWAVSWRKSWSLFIKWNVTERITGEGYNALLDKFGLSDWKNEFSPERIIKMSPAQLIAKRREKEKLYNLPRLEVITDNLDIVAGKGKVSHYAEEYN